MPRAKTILQSVYPYNISARCINKEWFKLPMPFVWNIFAEELSRTINDHHLVVHSFVLMSNHFHLIATTPEANISQCMQQFMRRTSLRLAHAGNRINETFAGRHYKCILQHPTYYLNTYKYNYRNPVTAGICNLVEEYPYSTLPILSKNLKKITIEGDFTFSPDPVGTLEWLNTAPDPSKMEAMRCGLKHQHFKSSFNRGTKKPIISENDLI